jgi:hypothetical protein
MKYLLPCDKCGEKTPIDVNQAGQQATCRCGQMLEIPSLRGIRELEVLDDVGTSVSRSAWSVGRRVVFVIGLVVCVIGLAVLCIAIINRTQIEVPERPVANFEEISAEMDAMTPAQAWDEWTQLRAEGLGHYYPPNYVRAQRAVSVLRTFMVVSASVAIAGLLMSVGACFFPAARRGR